MHMVFAYAGRIVARPVQETLRRIRELWSAKIPSEPRDRQKNGPDQQLI